MNRSSSILRRLAAVPSRRPTFLRSFAIANTKDADEALGMSVTNNSETFDPRKFFTRCESEGDVGLKRLRRSLLYRCRQTGWLETDLIMGRWAGINVDKLNAEQLKQLSDLCQEEILDIFKWIVKQAPPPAAHDNEVMSMLQDYAKMNPPARLPVGLHLGLGQASS